jgi:hypothetical protein
LQQGGNRSTPDGAWHPVNYSQIGRKGYNNHKTKKIKEIDCILWFVKNYENKRKDEILDVIKIVDNSHIT